MIQQTYNIRPTKIAIAVNQACQIIGQQWHQAQMLRHHIAKRQAEMVVQSTAREVS